MKTLDSDLLGMIEVCMDHVDIMESTSQEMQVLMHTGHPNLSKWKPLASQRLCSTGVKNCNFVIERIWQSNVIPMWSQCDPCLWFVWAGTIGIVPLTSGNVHRSTGNDMAEERGVFMRERSERSPVNSHFPHLSSFFSPQIRLTSKEWKIVGDH